MRIPGGTGRIVQAQIFSYRSLLTFKLMKELPFAYREARRLLRLMMPKFAILGMHHEDRPGPGKFCRLHRDPRGGPDRLEVCYQPADAETQAHLADERRVVGFVRRLGCIPLKTIRPGHGASLHYAGTFPMAPAGGDLTCDRDSRLRATRAVYLADGSVFPWLSPKGLTLNIMANADRVGTLVAVRIAESRSIPLERTVVYELEGQFVALAVALIAAVLLYVRRDRFSTVEVTW